MVDSCGRASIVIGIVVVVIIFISAMVGTSLRKINSDEVGVAYNIHQKTLSDTVKREGLHAGSPGYKFIIFKSVFQSITFDVECLNKDGVETDLYIKLQYRARPNDLVEIIKQFKDSESYLDILKSIGESSIHDACSGFTTTQLQSQRASFQDLVRNTLGRRYATVWADVEDLQVESIKRPETYEEVVRNKEAAKENIKVAENQRPRQLVEARTDREEALAQAQITVQSAESAARVLLSKARAEVESIRAAYEAEAQAFLKLKQDSLNTNAGLLSYMGVRAISENNNSINVAIDAPAKTKYTYV